ncbi:MAG: hypothetical protein R6U78_05615 [Bacteroidales bacterium]
MAGRKSSSYPGTIRTISIIMLLTGAVIAFRVPVIRMAGYVLLGAGAFGLILSFFLSGGNTGSRENEDHRKFF